MASTNKRLRELASLAESLGLKFEVLSKNKHIKIRLTASDGRTALQSVPSSTSSESGINNANASIKRFARGSTT